MSNQKLVKLQNGDRVHLEGDRWLIYISKDNYNIFVSSGGNVYDARHWDEYGNTLAYDKFWDNILEVRRLDDGVYIPIWWRE